MYTTTRNIAGGTLMTCKDCGHAVTMNKMCERPLQAATDMLKHMAAHNASRAFASVGRLTVPEPQPVPPNDLAGDAPANPPPWIASAPPLPN
jgi:hypothetical protein